jgi:hypothetical protein
MQVPAIIRIATRMFVATLQHQATSDSSVTALQSLSSLLRELPALSLFSDPDDCIVSMQEWLLTVISTGSKCMLLLLSSDVVCQVLSHSLTL